jgi:hypothetical protein
MGMVLVTGTVMALKRMEWNTFYSTGRVVCDGDEGERRAASSIHKKSRLIVSLFDGWVDGRVPGTSTPCLLVPVVYDYRSLWY